MSAYIVEDKTINRIVTQFINDQYVSAFEKELEEIVGSLNPQKIGEAMFTLNCESIEQRYGRNAGMGEDETYMYDEVKEDTLQVISSLSCFLYQSCEGNCTDKPLYKLLLTYKGKLAMDVVEKMPEYSGKEWG